MKQISYLPGHKVSHNSPHFELIERKRTHEKQFRVTRTFSSLSSSTKICSKLSCFIILL
jgi:hypothetical protein